MCSDRFTGLATSCWNKDVTELAQQKNTDHNICIQHSLRSEEAHRRWVIPICRQLAVHFSLQTPLLLYRYKWSSAINTYAGPKDALNIVEACIRKIKKKRNHNRLVQISHQQCYLWGAQFILSLRFCSSFPIAPMLKNRSTAKGEDFRVYLSFPLKCFTGKNLLCYDLATLSSLPYITYTYYTKNYLHLKLFFFFKYIKGKKVSRNYHPKPTEEDEKLAKHIYWLQKFLYLKVAVIFHWRPSMYYCIQIC